MEGSSNPIVQTNQNYNNALYLSEYNKVINVRQGFIGKVNVLNDEYLDRPIYRTSKKTITMFFVGTTYLLQRFNYNDNNSEVK